MTLLACESPSETTVPTLPDIAYDAERRRVVLRGMAREQVKSLIGLRIPEEYATRSDARPSDHTMFLTFSGTELIRGLLFSVGHKPGTSSEHGELCASLSDELGEASCELASAALEKALQSGARMPFDLDRVRKYYDAFSAQAPLVLEAPTAESTVVG